MRNKNTKSILAKKISDILRACIHAKERKLLQSALGEHINILEKAFRKTFESDLTSCNSDPEIPFHNVFCRMYVHVIEKNSENNQMSINV